MKNSVQKYGAKLTLIEKSENFSSKLDYEFFKNFESNHTLKSYRSDIKQFFEFIDDNFPEITAIKKIERVFIVAFRNWLTDLEFAPKTINRKLSSISSYFDFLVEKGLIDFNPSTAVRRPRQEVVNPTNDMSDNQVIKLFETVDAVITENHLKNRPNKSSGLLHKAIIYLLFSTGIRKSELVNLRLKDYKQINDTKVIEVRTKGGKFLTKVLHPKCGEILDEYIHWMSSIGRNIHMEDWIFQPTKNPLNPNDLTRPLSSNSVDYIVKLYTKKAGIDKIISPHSARASYIGSALESGTDIWKVSQDVGHSNIQTTQGYNKRRQALENSPVYNLGFLKKKVKDTT